MSEDAEYFQSIQEYRSDYKRLFLAALEEGLRSAKSSKESGKYIGNYYNFPQLSFRKNGLPSLSSSIGGGPVDYNGCFHTFGGKPLVNEDDLENFNSLVEFVRSNSQLRKRFCIAEDLASIEGLNIEVDKIQILSAVKNCINRYFYKFNSFEYEQKFAEDVANQALAYIFDENLNIEICIPILFLSFGFEEHEITSSASIRRISAEQHLARYDIKSYNTSAHEKVIHSATHAFVLKGWHVPNTKRMWDFNVLSSVRAYPLDMIDKFFGAVRICTKSKTGYGQIYSVSCGWESRGLTSLPCVMGATLRAYPSEFEDYYWNIEAVPYLSEEQISQITEVFKQLSDARENSISLSLKRLNRCLVRDEEEDAVLDATIALEALLSDDGNQEMTHKLAMRVGALAALDKSFERNPVQAFNDIKSIYGYRSAIVHGSKSLEKRRTIKINDSTHKPAYEISVDYVRLVMKVLLGNPRFRDPKVIDQELLLGVSMGA